MKQIRLKDGVRMIELCCGCPANFVEGEVEGCGVLGEKIKEKCLGFPKFCPLEDYQDRESLQDRIVNLDERLAFEGRAQQDQNLRITEIEKELKDQREDYHAHIRQLVEENAAAHRKLDVEQKKIESRLDVLERYVKRQREAYPYTMVKIQERGKPDRIRAIRWKSE